MACTNDGRVQVDASYPYAGNYALVLDDSVDDNTFSYARAILTVDLSGQSGVLLDFWWMEFGGDQTPDGVSISADNGANWYKVVSFYQDPTGWRHEVVDLDQELADHGLAYNDHFQIKFESLQDEPAPTDGYVIDDVRVRAAPQPVPAAFPYYDGFESGALGDEWLSQFTNEGRVRVDGDYAYAGDYGLVLDDWEDDLIFSSSQAILTVDLSGQSGVLLDFWWMEFGGDQTPDGVSISADNGANWYKVVSFYQDPTGWRHEVVDLDQELAANGLAYNDHFQIKFESLQDEPAPTDGYVIDDVRLRENMPPTLTWVGDPDYEMDGLHPESGYSTSDFVYRIKYSDADSDAPGSVQVHIKAGGTGIVGSPFTMACQSGDYQTGVVCSYTRSGLAGEVEYSYYFSGADDLGHMAGPTQELAGPVIIPIYLVNLPFLTNKLPPRPGAPTLNAINNTDGEYTFNVNWSQIVDAETYTLQRDRDPSFPDPVTAYQGSNTSATISVSQTGMHYFRVQASNIVGASPWSNVVSTMVTQEPPPCPQSGNWSGVGNRFSIDFKVYWDGSTCRLYGAHIHLVATCHSGGVYWPFSVETYLEDTTITDFQFESASRNLETQVDGEFSTPNLVNGTWDYESWDYISTHCYWSGTWSGSP